MISVIVLAPLVGAILAGLFWRLIGELTAQVVTTTLVFVSAILSWALFFTFNGVDKTVILFRFIESGTLVADWAFRIDRLTTVMLVVVTTVSAFVHLYSFGYMAHDDHWDETEYYKARFFAYLSLFTFAMLMLVTADNLAQLFFGWEGVGLVSYLLIGFYYKKASANSAAIKAFVVNRVGDFGLIIGMMAIFFLVDSVAFDDIFRDAERLAQTELPFLWRSWNAAEIIAFFLFIGAMGKSAQLFLHTWLPDAMEGPTPVSALIHAATMVTAGVFLVCRFSPIYEFAPSTKQFVVVIGVATAIFAASVALVQNDIKRVIAYSTCSQLGFMFAAAGVGAYSAAMFHLFTHAFFKALLFLGAGSVIVATHHDQDLRNYRGLNLRKRMPITFAMMLIGTLSITGVGIPLLYISAPIGFAGFVSKDSIVESVFAGGSLVAFLGLVVAAAMTAFYSWRLIFLTFFSEADHLDEREHHPKAHHPALSEASAIMTVPLVALSTGAIFFGSLFYKPFFGSEEIVRAFFGTSLFISEGNMVIDDAHHVPKSVKFAPFLAMLLGFGLAFLLFLRSPRLRESIYRQHRLLYQFLYKKWLFDEIYDRLFVRPVFWLGQFLWRYGDGKTIDGFINLLALAGVPRLTRGVSAVQSGFLATYALAIAGGVTFLTLWIFIVF